MMLITIWSNKPIVYIRSEVVEKKRCTSSPPNSHILSEMLTNIIVVVSVFVALFTNSATACVSGQCKNGMCSDIPANNQVSGLGD